jgi:hypothetical protein
MVAACWASFAILAGGLAALYGLGWYKNRKQDIIQSTRKVKKKKVIILLKNHLPNS